MNPADFGLPAKYMSWRENQFEAVRAVLASKASVFLLEAATGSGKTVIGAAVQKIKDIPAVYCCTTKNLQEQVLRDFPYARVLKGRANYPCGRFMKQFPALHAGHCTRSRANPCDLPCAYDDAKRIALSSPLAVLNTSYLLSEINYAGAFSGIPFLIIDECDTLEDELMGFVELVITSSQLDRLQLEPPKYKTKFEAWVDWAKPALKQVNVQITQLDAEVESEWGSISVQHLKAQKELGSLASKLAFFIREVDANWVWYPEDSKWTFKPVLVSKYANAVLWKHVEHTLAMSATILDHSQMMKNLGIPEADSFKMPCVFPAERRTATYMPVGDMGRKTLDEALPKINTAVNELLDKHKHSKGLIHTVSYKIAKYLMDRNKGRLITHNTFNRNEVLEKFKKSDKPLVLVSPSMERGIDLPHDECEFIVIAKTPFPFLGDPQISKRLYGFKDGRRWYAHKTVSALVQMTGRGMRSADDHCESYILDSQFGRLYSDQHSLFPEWWTDALKRGEYNKHD